jgi:hypothetical protein
MGRCLVDEKVNGTSFTTNLPGIFVVTVNTRQGMVTRKVMMH